MKPLVIVSVALSAIILLHVIATSAEQSAEESSMTDQPPARVVPDTVMRRIHDEVKTPFKHGVVLRGDNGRSLDCPSVFRHNGAWHMIYVVFDDRGYETWLATSPDLLAWTVKGRVLSFREGTWDQHQAAGYVALQDTTWGGTHELETHNGVYWMSYIGGALEGYETDPLSIGVTHTADPAKAVPWERHPEPVLTPSDPGARPFETVTLYKSHVIRDPEKRLGAPFVMYYNGKDATGTERIGMALSDDMTRWRRHGDGPVIDNDSGISGDPQVVRIGDVWVMFYFGAFWKPKAFDTFACSYDLVNWTKWEGPHLVEPSEPWDETFAHKPWVIKHDGVVYHFYCAVGSEGRVIALATSRDLR